MSAQTSWASEALNRAASFEIPAALPENTGFELCDRNSPRIVGTRAALRCVLDMVRVVAATDSTVLIYGETGAGKESIAHAVHNASRRLGRPFIKLNCAAIPLDLLETRRMGKQVDCISPETMAAFESYSWPGNIRELQNLVERAVIHSRDGVRPNPHRNIETEFLIPSPHRTRTFHSSMALEDSDRALILETLEQAGWIVGGPRGAAGILGPKRTTLLTKMKRLGISRPISQEGTDVFEMARRDAQL